MRYRPPEQILRPAALARLVPLSTTLFPPLLFPTALFYTGPFVSGFSLACQSCCNFLCLGLGVVLRVQLVWDRCMDRLAPCLERRVQFGRFLRFLRGQVVGLADVVMQVVKLQAAIFKVLVEFPVTEANDTAGPRAEQGVTLFVDNRVISARFALREEEGIESHPAKDHDGAEWRCRSSPA